MLMAGRKAQMVFVDPPYNVPIDGHVCGFDKAFLKCLYEAEVSFVDEQFGLVIDALRTSGLLEKSIVIVTSDRRVDR